MKVAGCMVIGCGLRLAGRRRLGCLRTGPVEHLDLHVSRPFPKCSHGVRMCILQALQHIIFGSFISAVPELRFSHLVEWRSFHPRPVVVTQLSTRMFPGIGTNYTKSNRCSQSDQQTKQTSNDLSTVGVSRGNQLDTGVNCTLVGQLFDQTRNRGKTSRS